MADEDKTPQDSQPPITPPKDDGSTPSDDKKQTSQATVDPVEFGRLKKENEDLKVFKQKVEPVLETLASDPDLLKRATEVHDRRLGKTSQEDKKEEDKKEEDKVPQASVRDQETRTAMINTITSDFERSVGINKLEPEKQQEVRGLVGQMIKEMLDPNDNKTIGQVFNEVSLPKLGWYLDKAYKLINRDSEIEKAKEQGKNVALTGYDEGTGTIGSVPGGSLPPEDVVLTPRERETIKKAGWDEKKYLENKKAINQMRASE